MVMSIYNIMGTLMEVYPPMSECVSVNPDNPLVTAPMIALPNPS